MAKDGIGKANSPFVGLEVSKVDAAPATERDKRDPLPRDVILPMRERMTDTLRGGIRAWAVSHLSTT